MPNSQFFPAVKRFFRLWLEKNSANLNRKTRVGVRHEDPPTVGVIRKFRQTFRFSWLHVVLKSPIVSNSVWLYRESSYLYGGLKLPKSKKQIHKSLDRWIKQYTFIVTKIKVIWKIKSESKCRYHRLNILPVGWSVLLLGKCHKSLSISFCVTSTFKTDPDLDLDLSRNINICSMMSHQHAQNVSFHPKRFGGLLCW